MNKPFGIGNKFIVIPLSEEIALHLSDGRIPLLLGPGRAFGSGEHETTASCLEEMEKNPMPRNGRVLDLGCGTGILSIAAAKLGAGIVIAVDPERDAVEATRRNSRLNGVEASVSPILGDITALGDTPFHLILANIYGDILVPAARKLASLVPPEGILILSGIHYDYAYDVKTAYSGEGLRQIRARALENFVTLVFVR